MKKLIIISAIGLITIISFNSFKNPLSNPTPPSGYSGAPTQNRTCRNCHGDFPLNTAGGSVNATGLPTGFYIPGKAYHFSITITNPVSMPVWGFVIKAVIAGTSGTALGTFSTLNPNTVVSSNELKHNNAVGFTGTTYTYSNLTWTAPSTGTSAVSFYMTGVAGDWDGSETGDYVYSKSILSIPIPVTLGDITGKICNNTAVIEWNTYSESGARNFELEKSSDGRNFNMIKSIASTGNSNSIKNYSYVDNDLPKNEEIIYYRLKMIDLDGRFDYSKVIMLKHALSIYIDKCYPDVIDKYGKVNINMVSNKEQKAYIAVYSINGIKIHEKVQLLSKGMNAFMINGFNKANAGVYIIKINAGDFSDHRKVVIQ